MKKRKYLKELQLLKEQKELEDHVRASSYKFASKRHDSIHPEHGMQFLNPELLHKHLNTSGASQGSSKRMQPTAKLRQMKQFQSALDLTKAS